MSPRWVPVIAALIVSTAIATGVQGHPDPDVSNPADLLVAGGSEQVAATFRFAHDGSYRIDPANPREGETTAVASDFSFVRGNSELKVFVNVYENRRVAGGVVGYSGAGPADWEKCTFHVELADSYNENPVTWDYYTGNPNPSDPLYYYHSEIDWQEGLSCKPGESKVPVGFDAGTPLVTRSSKNDDTTTWTFTVPLGDFISAGDIRSGAGFTPHTILYFKFCPHADEVFNRASPPHCIYFSQGSTLLVESGRVRMGSDGTDQGPFDGTPFVADQTDREWFVHADELFGFSSETVGVPGPNRSPVFVNFRPTVWQGEEPTCVQFVCP